MEKGKNGNITFTYIGTLLLKNIGKYDIILLQVPGMIIPPTLKEIEAAKTHDMYGIFLFGVLNDTVAILSHENFGINYFQINLMRFDTLKTEAGGTLKLTNATNCQVLR